METEASFTPRMLRKRVIPLLLRLMRGEMLTKAAKNLGWSWQTAGHWARRLEKLGYLRNNGRWAGYDLLQPALAFLDRVKNGEISSGVTIRHEHGGWKYRVIEREKKTIDWRKVQNVRNWDDFILKEEFRGIVRKVELHVTKNGAQLIIYSGPVEGETDQELIVLARKTCDLLAHHLQEKYQMRLDLDHPKPIEPAAGEWAPDVADPAVKAFVDANHQVRTADFVMDDSPRKKAGEIDFRGKRGAELAKTYVRAVFETPRQLDRIQLSQVHQETKLNSIEGKMTVISEAVLKVADATERLADLLAKAVVQNDLRSDNRTQTPVDPRRYS